jgi:FMN phosphatase YigB (HAD superfamily)/RimJ/RimL family protein N-acetyltransferase
MSDGPTIAGGRIRLRPVASADHPFLQTLWNDGRVMRYVGFPVGLGMTGEKMTTWWEGCGRWTATHLLIETLAGAPIGETGWGFPGDPGLLECKLAAARWGQGYATEALETLSGYVWEHTALEHLSVTPHPENQAARQLYRRLGFSPAPAPDGLDCGERSQCDYWIRRRLGSPPAPHALIFDWGGVIMRTADDGRRRAWERRLGLPPGAVDRAVFQSHAWNEAQLGRLPVDAGWRAIGGALGLDGAELDRFRRDFWGGDRLNVELVDWIARWRAAGHPVALLSNYTPELDRFLDRHQVRHLFDPVVISAHEGIMKPAARLYWRALNRAGLTPADALFVDDAAENVAGARRVGMHAVRFENTDQIIAAIERTLV